MIQIVLCDVLIGFFFSLSFFLDFFFFFHEIKKEKMIKVDNSRVGLEERQKGDKNTLGF